jgi:hypothetical protein
MLEDRVQIHNNGLPRALLVELNRSASVEHFARLAASGFPFYRTTFWHPLDRAPSNVFESVIVALKSIVDPKSEVVGVEWWFSVLRTDASPHWLLAPHFDRNNLSEKDPERIEHPDRASILFLNGVPDSELVITDQLLTAKGARPKQAREMVFVAPRRNRYVVFPGELYHGVIGRMWRAAKPPRLRIAMAINWWEEKPAATYLRDSAHCLTELGITT